MGDVEEDKVLHYKILTVKCIDIIYYRCGSWVGIVGGRQSITLQDPNC